MRTPVLLISSYALPPTCRRLSMTSTRKPRSASSRAYVAPAKPAPTIRMGLFVMSRREGPVIPRRSARSALRSATLALENRLAEDLHLVEEKEIPLVQLDANILARQRRPAADDHRSTVGATETILRALREHEVPRLSVRRRQDGEVPGSV